MPPRRRIAPEAGAAAVQECRDCGFAPGLPDRRTVATAVRYTLEELSARAPGHALEVRVPPHGAVQCLPGPRHTRGTPPGVVETDPATWLRCAVGEFSWAEAIHSGLVRASGSRADLSAWLPLA